MTDKYHAASGKVRKLGTRTGAKKPKKKPRSSITESARGYARVLIPLLFLLSFGRVQAQVSGTTFYRMTHDSTGALTTPFRALAFDYNNRLWAASGFGLYQQVASKADSVALLVSPDSNSFIYGRDNVRVVNADSADTDLLFGHGRGFTVLDSALFADSTMIDSGGTLVCNPIFCITPVDSSGGRLYWVGGVGGLVLYDLDSAAVDTSFTVAELPGPDVYDVVIDSNDGVWIATSGGLAAFRYSYLFTYDTSNSGLLDNFIYDLEVDHDGDVWCATDLGASQFDRDTTWTSHTDSLAGLAVRALKLSTSDSTMWIGSLGGLTAYEEDLPYPESPYRRYTQTSTGDSLTSNNVLSIAVYQDSVPFMYLGTDSTLVRFVESP